MDLTKSCRICLQQHDELKMDLIFNITSDKCEEIGDKIELCGGIKIKYKDNLPNKICADCKVALFTAYDFRMRCQENDLKLKLLEKVEVKYEVEFEDSFDFIADNKSEIPFHPDNLEPDIPEQDIPETIKRKTISSTKRKRTKASKPKEKIPKIKELQICELCGNCYRTSYQLTAHMRTHNPVKPFACEICGKKFAINQHIVRHMRTHTGERPFKCKYCDRAFSDYGCVIKHHRTHTNERPFKCKTCGNAFSYSHVLKTHMLTHTGEKPFRYKIANAFQYFDCWYFQCERPFENKF